MFNFLKKLFGGKHSTHDTTKHQTADVAENIVHTEPATADLTDTVQMQATEVSVGPVACGCGRSPTGKCVGLHNLTEDEWAIHKKNPANKAVGKTPAKAEKKPAKKTVKKTGKK